MRPKVDRRVGKCVNREQVGCGHRHTDQPEQVSNAAAAARIVVRQSFLPVLALRLQQAGRVEPNGTEVLRAIQ
jgi:hypothetical protein